MYYWKASQKTQEEIFSSKPGKIINSVEVPWTYTSASRNHASLCRLLYIQDLVGTTIRHPCLLQKSGGKKIKVSLKVSRHSFPEIAQSPILQESNANCKRHDSILKLLHLLTEFRSPMSKTTPKICKGIVLLFLPLERLSIPLMGIMRPLDDCRPVFL